MIFQVSPGFTDADQGPQIHTHLDVSQETQTQHARKQTHPLPQVSPSSANVTTLFKSETWELSLTLHSAWPPISDLLQVLSDIAPVHPLRCPSTASPQSSLLHLPSAICCNLLHFPASVLLLSNTLLMFTSDLHTHVHTPALKILPWFAFAF